MTDEFKLGDKAVKSVKLHTAAGVAKATPDSCHMNRGDLLAWYSGDGAAYRIQFKGDSPFGTSESDVPAGGVHSPGPVRKDEPGHGAKYPYRVFPGGEDPDVVVDD
jgi:hypothetical protein